MQQEKKEYIINSNVEKVFHFIYENRKKILEKDNMYNETTNLNLVNEKLNYTLESKLIKLNVNIDFKLVSSNVCKLTITAEYKYRNFVSDLFSYLSVNVEKILDRYISYVEKNLN